MAIATGCCAVAPAAKTVQTAGRLDPPAPPASVYPREARDLPEVRFAELPREAKETLRLIEEGGPFPYERDGQPFENREGILPDRPSRYYREYTVETPGSDDRGARRFVSGEAGERYYTKDHYDSFSRVVR
jgi:ribonuclease T1